MHYIRNLSLKFKPVGQAEGRFNKYIKKKVFKWFALKFRTNVVFKMLFFEV